MRSGSDGVEAGPGGWEQCDRSLAPACGGPGAGPPRLLRCSDRTVGLVQRASRADGPVPPAEIRHPWFGRRPAWLMPSNARRHANTANGALMNSL
ncbi:hypothetical protein LK07_22425 [Streptomyces pluripotens]|uniref:Uncharacterized protein n=1 Tax=Streptomyces pluripotens TaxID=1355015 RepID=A0A221P2L7_9ACTN|nr:hypothetical protein LK06_021270 [Streptomyces pluripotens]ASN26306.1 hypothetical protein LK07_22425 [Streptomyces pluripotens]